MSCELQVNSSPKLELPSGSYVSDMVCHRVSQKSAPEPRTKDATHLGKLKLECRRMPVPGSPLSHIVREGSLNSLRDSTCCIRALGQGLPETGRGETCAVVCGAMD